MAAEYIALANHNEAIRAEIAAYTVQVRTIQADALASIFRAHDIDPGRFPPWAAMMLVESISASCSSTARSASPSATAS